MKRTPKLDAAPATRRSLPPGHAASGGISAKPGKSIRSGDDIAFTLLELLVVIAIIGVLAAIAVPTVNSFKPDVKASATRQLVDDISRARQMAISQRTTVFMVFVPTNFWTYFNWSTMTVTERQQATNLFDKQGIGYNFVTLRSLGDQPGQHTPRYLSSWRTLPEGAFIPLAKFYNPAVPDGNKPVMQIDMDAVAPWTADIPVYRFLLSTNIPFPTESSRAGIPLPCFAFNYQGQLAGEVQRNEVIPLAKGTVGFSRDTGTKTPKAMNPTFREVPAGNVTNAYNVINIDWLTGRPRVQHVEVR